jgi:hypothetical protein
MYHESRSLDKNRLSRTITGIGDYVASFPAESRAIKISFRRSAKGGRNKRGNFIILQRETCKRERRRKWKKKEREKERERERKADGRYC